MPYRTALAALILTMPLALGASGNFKTGDRIFIRAQVLGCGEDIRTVDFADVEGSNPETLLGGVPLSVRGKSTDEVQAEIEDAIEEMTGRRPGSISVIRVPRDDHEQASRLLMEFYLHQKHGCERQPQRHLDDKFWLEVESIAMHGTTRLFVPLSAHLRRNY